ncbi:unnamed protein product [Calypogeia fissa]
MGRDYTVMIAGVLLLACFATAQASDPELTTDFAVPVGINATTLDGSFFTNMGLRNVSAKVGNFATVTPINQGNFPALVGLGTSSALLQFPMGATNPPHTHPRGTELLYVIDGALLVGLVDTTDKLFTQTLLAGDLFVFPKGLVHFQINYGSVPVTAYAGFSSSNPGLVRLPNALFKSGIPDTVLATGFGVSTMVIDDLINATVS